MKIGVSSYSFSQYIRAGKMTQLGTVAKAAELGFDAIEFSGLMTPEGMTELEYAALLREEAQKYGLEISAYVVGANLAQDKESVRAQVERLKEAVDVAHVLGTGLFRHDVMYDYAYFRSFDQALPVIAEATRQVTEYAAGRGIRTMTENHGYVAQDSDRVERLVNAVNHPNYGVLVDIGNFACADEDPAEAVSRLANLAFHVHGKDFAKVPFSALQSPEGQPRDGFFETRGCNGLKGVAVGDGDIPVAQCVAILKRAKYDGYIDLEYEGMEDCIVGVEKGLQYLRNLV